MLVVLGNDVARLTKHHRSVEQEPPVRRAGAAHDNGVLSPAAGSRQEPPRGVGARLQVDHVGHQHHLRVLGRARELPHLGDLWRVAGVCGEPWRPVVAGDGLLGGVGDGLGVGEDVMAVIRLVEEDRGAPAVGVLREDHQMGTADSRVFGPFLHALEVVVQQRIRRLLEVHPAGEDHDSGGEFLHPSPLLLPYEIHRQTQQRQQHHRHKRTHRHAHRPRAEVLGLVHAVVVPVVNGRPARPTTEVPFFAQQRDDVLLGPLPARRW
mmetsp:Transcript_68/g.248  ORF Transcript_68/g.248 Transcript_68/m.248 type:complete len:265 (+) Transcript_68:2025-2819(+)